MEFSYRCQLHKVEECARLEKERTGVENNMSVTQFHLDSCGLMQKYYVARAVIVNSLPGSPEQSMAYQRCAILHQEFLDTFGRELQPKIVSYKSTSHAKTSGPTESVPKACSQCAVHNTMIDDVKSANYVCTHCGFVLRYGIAHGMKGIPFQDRRPSPPRKYQYQPDKHFEKILLQVQGRSIPDIPTELLQRLQLEFRKRRVLISDITPKHVRYLLRKLRKPKLYQEVVWITRQLNPKFKPIFIKDHHQEALQNMFHTLHQKFPKVIAQCSPQRRNFVAYHAIAKSLCVFLGFPQYATCFTSSKCRKTQQGQEHILQKLFAEMNVKYQYND